MSDRTAAVRNAGLLAGLVLLAGCGGGDGSGFSKESATDILTASSTDMQALTSLRMAGDIDSGGQQVGFDLELTTDGDCQGTFAVGDGSAEIIAVGGHSWMKPDHAFWSKEAGAQAPQIEKIVGDKWVAIPSGSDLTSVCDLDSFLKKLQNPRNGKASRATVVGTENVAGQDAVRVSDKDKGGVTTDGWVSTDDPHYLLKLQVLGRGGGTVTFSDFDVNTTITAPDPSDVADLTNPTG